MESTNTKPDIYTQKNPKQYKARTWILFIELDENANTVSVLFQYAVLPLTESKQSKLVSQFPHLCPQ